jgi:hypothetical protein
MEVRLEDRHQHQIHRHLHHTVFDRGDAQAAIPSAGFGDLHPAYRRGPVRFAVKLLLQRGQPRCFHLCIGGQFFDAHPIDSGRSCVRFDAPPCCCQHVGALHFSVQTPKPVLRLGLRFPIQGDLQLPDFIGCC